MSDIATIIYSEINRLRDARENKKEQLNVVKELVKKAVLKFYLDWTSYRNSVKYNTSAANDILLDYVNLFIDVSVEVYDILPMRLIDKVTGIATRIREGVDEMELVGIGITLDEMFSKPDECAQDALQIYKTFNEYFKEVSYDY